MCILNGEVRKFFLLVVFGTGGGKPPPGMGEVIQECSGAVENHQQKISYLHVPLPEKLRKRESVQTFGTKFQLIWSKKKEFGTNG